VGGPETREAAVRSIEALIVSDAALVPDLVGGDSLKSLVALLDSSIAHGSCRRPVLSDGTATAAEASVRLQRALLSCLANLCAIGEAEAQAVEQAGGLQAAVLAAACPDAPPAVKAQALVLLAHAARHSPSLARAAAAAGAVRPALDAMIEPCSPKLQAAGATLLLEVARQRCDELAAEAVCTQGAAVAIAQYLQLEANEGSSTDAVGTPPAAAPLVQYDSADVLPSGIQFSASSGGSPTGLARSAPPGKASTHAINGTTNPASSLGLLLAGTIAGSSAEQAQTLLAARVPQQLVVLLQQQNISASAAGTAAWALHQFAQHGVPFVAALVAMGVLQPLVTAYCKLVSPPGSSSRNLKTKQQHLLSEEEQTAAARIKATIKLIVRGCSSAAALEPLVSVDVPPVLLRHVLERLAVLLQPAAAGAAVEVRDGTGSSNSSMTSGGAAERRAFVSAGGLARLQTVVAAAEELAGGDSKLQQRLHAAAAAINALFPAEIVAYYAAAAEAWLREAGRGSCGGEAGGVEGAAGVLVLHE